MEEFILLSYYPICVSGSDRINLGKGKVGGPGGAWRGQIGQIFPKTRVLDRTNLFYPINVVWPFWGFILSETGFR